MALDGGGGGEGWWRVGGRNRGVRGVRGNPAVSRSNTQQLHVCSTHTAQQLAVATVATECLQQLSGCKVFLGRRGARGNSNSGRLPLTQQMGRTLRAKGQGRGVSVAAHTTHTSKTTTECLRYHFSR
jgi:hypothetical protein